jgi:transposase-like protein
MAQPYSMDLRERVVATVAAGATVCEAALRFGVAVSTAVKWSQPIPRGLAEGAWAERLRCVRRHFWSMIAPPPLDKRQERAKWQAHRPKSVFQLTK